MLADALPQCPSIKAVYIDWNPLPKAAEVDTPAITGGDSKEGDGAPAEEKGAEEEEGEGKQAAPSAPPAAVVPQPAIVRRRCAQVASASLRHAPTG